LKVTRTPLDGALVLQPEVFRDARGFFMESHNQDRFDAAVGYPVRFVQDNHSQSSRGVLRGLHYQVEPHAQGKLVRVAHGAVFSVAVDLRRSSASFGRWAGFELSARNRCQLWLPRGLAHGFLVISRGADCLYKTTAPYVPQAERGLRWDDPTLAIAWPALGHPPVLSAKDANASPFADLSEFL